MNTLLRERIRRRIHEKGVGQLEDPPHVAYVCRIDIVVLVLAFMHVPQGVDQGLDQDHRLRFGEMHCAVVAALDYL